MFYVTVPEKDYTPKLSKKDLIDHLLHNTSIPNINGKTYKKTRTYRSGNITHTAAPAYRSVVRSLADRVDRIDKSWRQFSIPKRSGGLRQITTPNEELKAFQKEILNNMQFIVPGKVKYVWEHDIAHAFVMNRSTLTALQEHQKNQSRWFLKLDLKDFFPTFTKEFILHQARMVFPLTSVIPEFTKLLDACIYEDHLPQGAVTSPFLTNILMVPIDHELVHRFYGKYIVTRYADDILISSKYDFDYKEVVAEVQNLLEHNSPFQLNEEKTRYGSNAGRNWNLGLMYNQTCNITVGHTNRRTLLAMMHNFFRDQAWSVPEIQELQGKWAYYTNVQPEQAQRDLLRLERKTGHQYQELLKKRLN